jgi:hypothetical protein
MTNQIEEFKAKLDSELATTIQEARREHARKVRLVEKYGLADQDVVHHLGSDHAIACRRDVKDPKGRNFIAYNCHNTTHWDKPHNVVTCPKCLATRK